ncbi:MAG: glycoside hydrolase family 32 protein [Candidatus Sulfotelmatobacter sp.]
MSLSRRAFLQLLSTAAAAESVSARVFPPPTARVAKPPVAKDYATEALCRKLASDPLRPQYHLLPSHNWMNDPNGPIYFRGRYHMFHQYNPQGATWGNMHWAHATSPDMLHWHHEPIALSPTPGGPDQDGVFSGSAVLDNGIPTVIYTGVTPPSGSDATLRDGTHTWRETQCLAVAEDDDLRRWKKLLSPVIAAPPPGLDVTGFRDPMLWREGENWMLALGSGIRNKGGAILLYSSPDLRHWTYLHPLVQGTPSGKDGANPVDTGYMWECPDFFPLADKHVLLISTMGKVHWKVGTYANQLFTPEKEGLVDWGSYYAAKTMLDRYGTRILWGWIPESRPDADLIAAGWAGVMSLPRTVSLSRNGELQTQVIETARRLRTVHTQINFNESAGVRARVLNELRIQDLCAELQLELHPTTDDFAIRLRSDSEGFAALSFTNKNHSRELQVNAITAPIPERPGAPIQLQIFLDGSVLEIFANGATALTARVYQKLTGPIRLSLEGNAELRSLDVWQIKPISTDRLTGSLCP